MLRTETIGSGRARSFLVEKRAGFERYEGGSGKPRHAHAQAHASIVLETGFRQNGYAGRIALTPGDVLIQPTLDRHDSHTPGRRSSLALHLPWKATAEIAGVYRLRDTDAVIRAAEQDPRDAIGLLGEMIDVARPEAPPLWDWPDLLAADLRAGAVRIGRWADEYGLARETVSRGFRKAFGVSPKTFATEIRAREAWLRIVRGPEPLALVAAELGYADQAHMTRDVHALTGFPPGRWRRAGVTFLQDRVMRID